MPMDTTKNTMVNVIMTHGLKDKLKELADAERRSMSGQIVYLLEQYLKEHGYLDDKAD
jgi:hypothetical protein